MFVNRRTGAKKSMKNNVFINVESRYLFQLSHENKFKISIVNVFKIPKNL